MALEQPKAAKMPSLPVDLAGAVFFGSLFSIEIQTQWVMGQTSLVRSEDLGLFVTGRNCDL